MKRRLIIFASLTAISLVFILGIIPKIQENRIREDAPSTLKLYGFEIIKEGEFDMWKSQVDYIVKNKKTGDTDTVNVRMVRGGALVIEPYK